VLRGESLVSILLALFMYRFVVADEPRDRLRDVTHIGAHAIAPTGDPDHPRFVVASDKSLPERRDRALRPAPRDGRARAARVDRAGHGADARCWSASDKLEERARSRPKGQA
jgi:hypothetical protein